MTGPARAAGRRPATLLGVLVTAGLGALGCSVLLPGPLAAATAKPCVGIVVDARLLGGDVRTGCAEGDPDSGLEALTAAGFRYAFVPRQPGLVCQIDQVPECSRHGTTTYWSYWHRAKGSRTWVYSSLGAGTHDPAPGSTEAWVWQDGGRRQPPDVSLTSICPQLVGAAPPSAPAKTPEASPSRVRATGGAGASSPSRRTTGEATPTTATAPPTSARPASPPASSDPALPGSSTSTKAALAGGAPADPGPDPARWVGLVLGCGLVAALGAAALARSRRSGGTP